MYTNGVERALVAHDGGVSFVRVFRHIPERVVISGWVHTPAAPCRELGSDELGAADTARP